MTPRKAQQRPRRPRAQSNLGSQSQIQPSDYESETPYIAPPTRTNTDLNLSVLRRYVPTISSILSIAPSAVIYNFLAHEQTWDRAEIDGTLFVCQLFPADGDKFCIVVLNKRGLDNLIVDLGQVRDVEITSEFLILRWVDNGTEKIQGVYIHADKEDTREVNCRCIKHLWEVSENRVADQVSSYGEEVFA